MNLRNSGKEVTPLEPLKCECSVAQVWGTTLIYEIEGGDEKGNQMLPVITWLSESEVDD